jgi:hypothetical protein
VSQGRTDAVPPGAGLDPHGSSRCRGHDDSGPETGGLGACAHDCERCRRLMGGRGRSLKAARSRRLEAAVGARPDEPRLLAPGRLAAGAAAGHHRRVERCQRDAGAAPQVRAQALARREAERAQRAVVPPEARRPCGPGVVPVGQRVTGSR